MAKFDPSEFAGDSTVIPSTDLSIPMPRRDIMTSALAEDHEKIHSPSFANAKDIWIDYADNPAYVYVGAVEKGTTVRFRDSGGGKLKVVFLSPTGAETNAVLDSESCNLMVGGFYHFNCYFTPEGTQEEISPKTQWVIDVVPHRP